MASGDLIVKVADKDTLDRTYANTNAILAAVGEDVRIKANGAGWNIGSWSKRNLLNCILKIMSKTDNSQTAFGQGQTSGYVNDASQNYGHLATGTLKDKGQFFGYNDTTHEVKVLIKCSLYPTPQGENHSGYRVG